MAPRTREQQDAYNLKRRVGKDATKTKVLRKGMRQAEAKEMKRGSPNLGTAIKQTISRKKPEVVPKHDLAKQVKTLGADSLLPKAKSANLTKYGTGETKATAKAKTATYTMPGKVMMETITVEVKPARKKPFAVKEATAPIIKGVDPEPEVVEVEPVLKPKRDKYAPKTAPQAQPAPDYPHGPPTTTRTYRREFKGNGATARGRNGTIMQISVTFNPDQFAILRERAEFYGASLPETIRKCVLAGPLAS